MKGPIAQPVTYGCTCPAYCLAVDLIRTAYRAQSPFILRGCVCFDDTRRWLAAL